MKNGLQKAINYFGSQAALGRELGVKRATVNSWLKRRNKIPPEMAIKIEKVTEYDVVREEIRPDIYGK